MEESIVNSERHDNMEIEEKAKMVEKPEDAEKVIKISRRCLGISKKTWFSGIPTRFNISKV